MWQASTSTTLSTIYGLQRDRMTGPGLGPDRPHAVSPLDPNSPGTVALCTEGGAPCTAVNP